MTCSLIARSTSWALAANMAMVIAAPSVAQTQSPSQVPPGQTLEQRVPDGSFQFPAAQGLTAPDGADAIRFTLRDLRVDGGLTPLDARTQALKPAVGSQVSVADIYGYAASEKLEIVRIIEQSHRPANRTLDQLGIASRTFYP